MKSLDFDPKSVMSSALKHGWAKKADTAAANAAREKSEMWGIPKKIVVLFEDFIRQFTAPFDKLDFQLFCSRSNVHIDSATARNYLYLLQRAGVIQCLRLGNSKIGNSQFQVNAKRPTNLPGTSYAANGRRESSVPARVSSAVIAGGSTYCAAPAGVSTAGNPP